jgi:LysR family transcriptional regulator, glycine cleavage system transcriptional activator
LGSLRVFVAVADHLSFTRAADALGVTTSAASLQIRALEEYLARPLFRRNGRQVHLTSEGAYLLPQVQQALHDIERAIDNVRGERQSGPVKVTTLPSFLQQWLLPRMARFRAAHPGVDLHLHSSPNTVDFVREDFHLALRLGLGGWPNVRAEKLLEEWLLPVCTPALYAKYGPVQTVDDLRRYPLLHSISEPWTAWMFDGRADDASAGFRGALYDDSQAVVRLAVQGDGLALGRWCLVADDIAKGTLVAASHRPVRFERSYWMVWPNRAHDLPGVKAFLDWLRSEAAALPAPPGTPGQPAVPAPLTKTAKAVQ